MPKHADVIVIGVGSMGAAACDELARRGLNVLGLEQFDIPNALASHHGASRIIRLAYYEHPDYVPLLRRAYERWGEVEARSNRKLLYLTGGLYLGRSDSGFVRGSLESAAHHDLPHALLSRTEVAERYPQFRVPDDYVGFWQDRAGFLLPERCVAAFADQAMRHGAELRGHEPVTAWSADAHGVTVTTDQQTYHAGRLLITAGAWTGTLLQDLGVRLTVTRQALGWVWPKHPELFELGTMPVWAIDHPDGTQHYGFPITPNGDGGVGFKLAHHWHAARCDPDTVDRRVTPEDEADFRGCLKQYLPDADGPLLSTRICLYTNTPDSHFLVDRHPAHERVTFAGGFSGHGFKFAAAMGEALADLVTQGRSALPTGFLGLSRFKRTGSL